MKDKNGVVPIRISRGGNLLRFMAADVRMVFRDPLLAIMPFVPFLAGGALRFLLPLLSEFIEGKTGFRLLDYADLARVIILLFPGMFFGTVAGFLLLDDRDDGVSGYWGVTPAGRSGYLGARLGLFSVAAFVAGVLAVRVFGLGRSDLLREAAASALGAIQTPFVALFLAAFASDKVEGLSVVKALSGMDIVPLAILVALPVRFAAWPFPQYWAGETMLARNVPSSVALIAGAAASVVWVAALYGKYRGRIE